jgi:hypothetical protein
MKYSVPTLGSMVLMGAICGNGWASLESKYLCGSDTLQWRGVAPKALICLGGDTADLNYSAI